MKHVQPPPDGEVLPLDPATIFFWPRRTPPSSGRDEHLEWGKERAREYLDAGELSNAVASLGSDLAKHPELKPNPHLFLLRRMRALDGGPAAVRAWVEDFR
jgi:hypothetical protein